MKDWEIYHKMQEEDKFSNNVYKVCAGIALGSLGGVILNQFGFNIIFGIIASSIVTIPVTSAVLTIIKKKSDDTFIRDMQRAEQFVVGLGEIMENDHKITAESVIFYQEILDKCKTNNFIIDNNSNTAINQLLYLINANFYFAIRNSVPSLKRAELIDRVLDQIIFYLRDNNKKFSDLEVDAILKNCYFINADIRKEIVKEFKKAKYWMLDHYDYRILKKQNQEQEIEEPIIEHMLCQFNINDISYYQLLVDILNNETNDEVFTKYGDFSHINWDLESLKTIMCIIVENFKRELNEGEEVFYHFNLVASFMYNAAVYANLNKKDNMGINEFIQTFKGWSFFDFDLKLKALDCIFKEMNLDYSMHPFRNNAPKKENKKLVKFPGAKV